MITDGAGGIETVLDRAERELELAEVYAKRGKSRTARLDFGRASFHQADEAGWALRGGGAEGDCFRCATGAPHADGVWPVSAPRRLRLPAAPSVPLRPYREAEELSAPLLTEAESFGVLRALQHALADEMPAAVLVAAVLEEGAAEHELRSTLGVAARWRTRAAALRAVALLDGREQQVTLGATTARQIDSRRAAERLMERLAITSRGETGDGDRADVVLRPECAVRLLEALLPLLVGAGAVRRARAVQRGERLASPVLSVSDDGRLEGGLLRAPVDGVGVATGRVALVERGELRQPLLPWWHDGELGVPSGCVSRPSWRDVPRLGPTHLFIEPASGADADRLAADLRRGYLAVTCPSAPRVDWEAGRLDLPFAGYEIRDGRPRRVSRGLAVRGAIHRWLRGIEAVGGDLEFEVRGGALGAPSMRLVGLAVEPQP